MRPKQTCICLTHSVHEKCENVCVFAKTRSQSIFYNGSAICNKLWSRPTCCCSLTQRLVGWSSPVVSKVWIKIQGKLEKGVAVMLARPLHVSQVSQSTEKGKSKRHKWLSMYLEVRALFGRFVWRGVNIDDVTTHPCPWVPMSNKSLWWSPQVNYRSSLIPI